MDHHIVNQFGIDQTHFDNASKTSNWAYHTMLPRQQYIRLKKDQSKMLLKH